jgi:hypothetical protein
LYTEAPFNKAQANTPIQQLEPSESKAVFGNAKDFYLVRKDSREILSFNYEIEFVTNRPDLIIGSAMASNNPLVSGKGAKLSEAPKVYFFDEPINKFTNKVDLSKAIKVNGEYITSKLEFLVGGNRLAFLLPRLEGSTENMDFVSWAIVTPIKTISEKQYQDEDGKITTEKITEGGELLLASNKPSSEYSSVGIEELYFTGKSNIYE